MKKVFGLTGTLAVLAFPLVTFAQVDDLTGVGTFIIDTINNILVPVLFAVAFVVFLWGAFQTFIMGASSEETKDKGKGLMLWSLIGFFVMISVWGLVNILTGSVTFSDNTGPSSLPEAGITL